MTRRLTALLHAAETGSLRRARACCDRTSVDRDELAELVALVRQERARMYRRACIATHQRITKDLATSCGPMQDESMRHWTRTCLRAMRRIERILRGEPAFRTTSAAASGAAMETT